MSEINWYEARWLYTAAQLETSLSRRGGIDAEMLYRQEAGFLIQEMGIHLNLSDIYINNAIVNMHRFVTVYGCHEFGWTEVAASAIHGACKQTEQRRNKNRIIIEWYWSLDRTIPRESSREHHDANYRLYLIEEEMLKTLGSQPVITLPHFFVLKACAKIRVSNYFTKVAYYLISDILSLTTFCLRYRPTDLAMLAIHVVGVWSKWTPPAWFHFIDRAMTSEKLRALSNELWDTFVKAPAHARKRVMHLNGELVRAHAAHNNSVPPELIYQFDEDHVENGTNICDQFCARIAVKPPYNPLNKNIDTKKWKLSASWPKVSSTSVIVPSNSSSFISAPSTSSSSKCAPSNSISVISAPSTGSSAMSAPSTSKSLPPASIIETSKIEKIDNEPTLIMPPVQIESTFKMPLIPKKRILKRAISEEPYSKHDPKVELEDSSSILKPDAPKKSLLSEVQSKNERKLTTATKRTTRGELLMNENSEKNKHKKKSA